MLADFITLDNDLLECSDENLLRSKVTRTYIDGKCVYKSNNQ